MVLFPEFELNFTNGYSGRLTYWSVGSGEPVVFIHGLGSSKEAWLKNVRFISNQFHCIVPDLPGYGKSMLNDFSPGIREYASFLVAFCDQLHLSDVTLAGHSMGCLIAAYMVKSFPDRFKKMALFAPAGFESYNLWQKHAIQNLYTSDLTFHSSDEVIKWNYSLNFYKLPPDAEILINLRIALRSNKHFRTYCKTIENNVRSMLKNSKPEIWAELKIPSLIIYGMNDRLIPNPLAGLAPSVFLKTMKELMPAAIAEPVDKAGHFVMWEQSAIANKLLTEFLKD